MATRGERAHAQAERAGTKKSKKPPSRAKTAPDRAQTEAARLSGGRYAGGVTARRNVKLDRGGHQTYELEDSATGRPSRKSTRKGAHRAKTDDAQRRRARAGAVSASRGRR
jgi:hypothetical protein